MKIGNAIYKVSQNYFIYWR